jgi:hypothetical protein
MMLFVSSCQLYAGQFYAETEQEINQKIDILHQKFDHIQELVSMFESLAKDIALVLNIKYQIHKDVINDWLIKNDLLRISSIGLIDQSVWEDSDQSAELPDERLFKNEFKRLMTAQLAYLRTYIRLHNQLKSKAE